MRDVGSFQQGGHDVGETALYSKDKLYRGTQLRAVNYLHPSVSGCGGFTSKVGELVGTTQFLLPLHTYQTKE